MNILFMPTKLLAMSEGAGGLFDFNATLPLMAIQFILLTVALTFVFYKPVDEHNDDINQIKTKGSLQSRKKSWNFPTFYRGGSRAI